jgi:SAM-dependent methyltransferase
MIDFDAIHGTDTEGFVGMDALPEVVGVNARYAWGYDPTPVEAFDEIMAELGSRVDLSTLAFVDIGCGKGRVVMMAAERPFRYVYGIEFTRTLFEIAVKNWPSKPAPFAFEDAVQYEFPYNPLAIYMANPFDRPVTAIVMARLEMSLRENKREAWLINYKPTQRDLIGSVTHFQNVIENDTFDIARWRG